MLSILPHNIANLIAAGEVVSRPASVVKELVENSIDAGATSVSVVITDAGRTLIQVIDNGSGMSVGDAQLCFKRHATSKISSAQDLEHIITYGFRGEALASIAAVAHVTLKTRRKGDELGTQVEVAESKVSSCKAVATPEGTRFEIRDLFYNIPARRKFLKSDNVELRNIVQEFQRVALTRPGVAMKLTANGREIHNLPTAANLKQRIHDIFGMDMIKKLVPVEVNTTVVKVKGFIGQPQDSLKRQYNQFFFINGRYFRSPFFHKAVCAPYEKLVTEGCSPAYFIFLETDPEKTDVNIHPSKTEVKFEDEALIYEILQAAVKESLGKNDFTPSIDFDMVGAPDFPVFNSADSPFPEVHVPRMDYDPLFNPFDEREFNPGPAVDPSPSYGQLFQEPQYSGNGKLFVIHKKYIVTPVKSGLMIVDIRRARQRIFYEMYLPRIVERQPITQQTLFPQTIKLSNEDYLTLLEQPDLLARLGFDIRDFGADTVVVYGLPEGYSLSEESLNSSLDMLTAMLRDSTPVQDYDKMLAAKMADHAAASGMETFNNESAQLLIDRLFACREPNLSPDGRRCTAILTFEEIEKKL